MQIASAPNASGGLFHSMALGGILLMLNIPAAAAQPTPFLYIETIQAVPGGPLQMDFRDEGTGATGYVVEYSGVLGDQVAWTVDSGAVITSLGGGEYRIEVADPVEPNGFYRVVALTSSGPVVAQFAGTGLQVTEGGTAEALVRFSSPFTGLLTYRVEGPARGYSGPLSGSVVVNNSLTAAISFQIADNLSADELSFLTLIIDAGSSLRAGADSQALITIRDNDAVWDGGFVSEGLDFSFRYRRTSSGASEQAALISNGDGVIPAGEYPAQLSTPSQPFPASVPISLPSDASALGIATTMLLILEAEPAGGGVVVSDDEVQGTATLITTYPDRPHLSSSRPGRFILRRPPPAPSTVEVELVNNP